MAEKKIYIKHIDVFELEKDNYRNNNITNNYVILSNYKFLNHLINNLLFLDNFKYRSYKYKIVSINIIL